MTLLEEADLLMDRLPGWRAEIIGGVLTVTALPDISHAVVLTDLMRHFIAADLDGQETEVIQRIGLWLPTGPDDYAIPDLAIVDADIMEHQRENNCYGPEAFRLIVEVTSNNYNNDLRNKVAAYAEAKIPVYLIVNRKHGRVHVLTDPAAGGYDTHRVHAPGEQITVPDSIGAKVTLDVAELLAAGERKG
ncbi:Uma2 family endonuclease [Streptomyces sp. NBS 14/10]|uniref:Uma2 family endonuclease n=1 Tax=Streptomyces sp. NBS 14/10 TaxID=1945643 RepID=UPI000B7E74AB|nr:Uma2 family endonuclease [Streptomyces sp. NBS 14/10]KAK1186221.1 Uma2 family endonuclease [Streptomyces sp. NBS 14/10]